MSGSTTNLGFFHILHQLYPVWVVNTKITGVPQVKDLQLGEAGAIGAVVYMLSPGSQ